MKNVYHVVVKVTTDEEVSEQEAVDWVDELMGWGEDAICCEGEREDIKRFDSFDTTVLTPTQKSILKTLGL